jgi:hypothetical protein
MKCTRIGEKGATARVNLRRISTMYVRGYLQGSENGRVVTIALLY